MLVYDANRSECRALARRAGDLLPLGIPVVPWQQLPDLAVLGLDEEACRRSAWWIGVDGVPTGGSRAVVAVLVASRRWWSPLAVLLTAPGAGALVMLTLRAVRMVLARGEQSTPEEPPVVAPADGSIGDAPDTSAAGAPSRR